MKSIRIGVIAEDESDIDVLRAIVSKSTVKSFKIQRYLGHGCGKLRAKCRAWADQLYFGSCSLLIVVHDLDEFRIESLRAGLEKSIKNCSIKRRIVVIPIREIEAWLLADPDAIAKGMKINSVKRVADPEEVHDAKKKLAEIIYLGSKKTKRFLNTVHNKAIAAHLDVEKLARLSSFKPLRDFLMTNL